MGFDTLPDQVVNRQALAGFRFNMLVVGETACGKSTLLDTLFNSTFPDSREGAGAAHKKAAEAWRVGEEPGSQL